MTTQSSALNGPWEKVRVPHPCACGFAFELRFAGGAVLPMPCDCKRLISHNLALKFEGKDALIEPVPQSRTQRNMALAQRSKPDEETTDPDTLAAPRELDHYFSDRPGAA
jgi:hypothetical protein